MRRRWNVSTGWIVFAAALSACGGSEEIVGPDPVDELLEPFVGTWDAEVFTVTSDADTTIVADLMENGSFFFDVQPSGAYTAALEFSTDGVAVGPFVEAGQVTVTEEFITLRPNGGSPATSAYSFPSAGYLVLEGPTEFDFNLDGDLDPAEAYIELQRR